MSNTGNNNSVVTTKRFVLGVEHPLITTACASMLITSLGAVVVDCLAIRYGKKQQTNKKRKTTKKSSK